ncbi:MvaI/BcnI family restriction endonuclease [Holzapfeliella sp. JNUCC 80]
MNFRPKGKELENISKMHSYNQNDYVLIRLTSTMIEKNTIDATKLFRTMIQPITDYDKIKNGGKNAVRVPVEIYGHEKRVHSKVNLYRVSNKRGDPRFSISRINSLRKQNIFDIEHMLYITKKDSTLIILNVSSELPEESLLKRIFDNNSITTVADELIEKIKIIAQKGCHRSIGSQEKSAPKDAGDTLESLLGLSTNNRKTADYKNLIEIKSKREMKNRDTLFTKRPHFEGTPIASITKKDSKRVGEYQLYYGYDTVRKGEDCKELYITIGPEKDKKNQHGFFLKVVEEAERIEIWAPNPETKEAECSAYFKFEELKKQLEEKHRATVWVDVNEHKSNKGIFFQYTTVTLTLSPQFTTFLSMIESGNIVYDWRGYSSLKNRGKARNHGNAWRIDSKIKTSLFLSERKIPLD